jgi:hypothetical protein
MSDTAKFTYDMKLVDISWLCKECSQMHTKPIGEIEYLFDSEGDLILILECAESVEEYEKQFNKTVERCKNNAQ